MTTLAHVGGPDSAGVAAPATRSTIDPSAAIPTIHPSRNENPFAVAFLLTSISTTATIGMGLMRTPTAMGRD